MLMWAALGAVLGVVLRGVALPIGLGVVWVLGVENLISGVADSVLTALQPVRDVLPGVNAGSLASAVMPIAPARRRFASRRQHRRGRRPRTGDGRLLRGDLPRCRALGRQTPRRDLTEPERH